MNKILPFILLPILLILCHSTLGQNANIETLKEESLKIRSEAVNSVRMGLDYQALEKFQLFLEYRKKIYPEDKYFWGAGYLNIGIIYKNLGQLDLALDNYMLAEQSYLSRKDPPKNIIAGLYRNIGNTYREKLDYSNALNYFEQALNIYLSQPKIDYIDVSDAYYIIAEINYLNQNYDKAIQILNENMDKGDEFTAIFYNELLGIIYRDLGEYHKAIQYYAKTTTLAKNVYGSEDMDLAIIFMNNAELFAIQHRFEDGIKDLNEAFKIITEVQSKRGEELSRYFEIKANLYHEKSIQSQEVQKFKEKKKTNLTEAIKWYNEALNALSSTNKNIDIENIRIENFISLTDGLALLQQIGDAYLELALLEKQEQTSFYTNSLINALKHYESASSLTQQARREISSDESKIQLAEIEYQTFTKTIETAYLAYETSGDLQYYELAFHNTEQLKSSSVFDKLSNNLAKENSLIPDSLLQKEKKLNSIISIYNQKLFEENQYSTPDTTLLANYQQNIFETTKERDELNQFLENEYSDYYNLKYSKSMLSVTQIQERLDENELILEYVIVEPEKTHNPKEAEQKSQLYTFVIGKKYKRFLKQELDQSFNNSIENVFEFTSNSNYLFTKNNDSKAFCVAANSLYKRLLAQHSEEIKNKNLILIPDGHLHYISFDGLLQTLPDTSKTINFTQLDYLIRDYNISYANSANILFQNRKTKHKVRNKVLAFAPKYNAELFEMSNANYTLMPLPGVQKEVNAIANTINTTVFKEQDATEQNFRDACENFDILHLAMHAYINDSLPAFSRFAFSPQQNSDTLSADGWLNTTDIYNLNLNARLAVLSACNTGVGKLRKGEGMMSLARGFLYAGCPSIIMSLWEVEDKSGTEIMIEFYKNLKKGKTKDEALRFAKLSYLENSNSRLAHPHYWMGFKSIGDTSAIYTSYDVYFFMLLIVLILAFSIDQTLRLRRIRKQRKNL